MVHFRRTLKNYVIHHVEHAKDAIVLLQKENFDLICLDHDLGGTQINFDPEDCGTMVAEYLSANPVDSEIIIHSFNVVAAQRMLRLIRGAKYIPGYWLGKEAIIDYTILDGQSG